MRLTAETMEEVIDLLASGERSLDLRDATSIDVYSLLLLDLAVRHAQELGHPLRVLWPEHSAVRTWMMSMGFFADLKGGALSQSVDSCAAPTQSGTTPGSSAPASRGVIPLIAIEREDSVSRLVGAFDDRLADRFPIDESPRRRFLRILLELFQNVPQHANATGDIVDPHGLAAMRDDERGVFLAVCDKGIGLTRSLSVGGTPSRRVGSDADALRAVVYDGRSRFRDPGRGHELERIVRLVRSWEGTVYVRSGSALFYQSDLGGDIVDVAPFPGVQIALFIPRAAFGIGEAAFGETGVESRGDPGFNEHGEDNA